MLNPNAQVKLSFRFLLKKAMYIRPTQPSVKSNQEQNAQNSEEDRSNDQGPPNKKRKGKRGMNKNRPRQPRPDQTSKLCSFISNGEECIRGDKCFFGHSVEEYLKSKQPDIGEKCIVHERFGKCTFGLNCRFSKSHIDDKFINIVNEELCSKMEHLKTKDTLKKELQISLRKKQYKFPSSDKYLSTLKQQYKGFSKNDETKPVGSVTDEDTIKLRPSEKKKVKLSRQKKKMFYKTLN